jgi:hypothetical protein
VLAPLLAAATNGVPVIRAMLIVGLIFLGVIGIGELVHAMAHRRQARRARPY